MAGRKISELTSRTFAQVKAVGVVPIAINGETYKVPLSDIATTDEAVLLSALSRVISSDADNPIHLGTDGKLTM
jgi:hypothetical protein